MNIKVDDSIEYEIKYRLYAYKLLFVIKFLD